METIADKWVLKQRGPKAAKNTKGMVVRLAAEGGLPRCTKGADASRRQRQCGLHLRPSYIAAVGARCAPTNRTTALRSSSLLRSSC